MIDRCVCALAFFHVFRRIIPHIKSNFCCLQLIARTRSRLGQEVDADSPRIPTGPGRLLGQALDPDTARLSTTIGARTRPALEPDWRSTAHTGTRRVQYRLHAWTRIAVPHPIRYL